MQKTILKLLTIFTITTNINAAQILSPMQENLLKVSKEKIKEDASKLGNDWINPITYTYSYVNNEVMPDTKKSILSINQPIFRSGGIYSAIKYSSNVEKSSNLDLDIQKINLISQALNIALSIKKLDIQIQQQQNLLSNANIDLKIKKESIFNGLLDISFLNNSLISKNRTALSLLTLQFNKDNLINSLKTISELSYNEIKLPKLDIISKEDFVKNNLNIKKDAMNIKNNDYLKGITNAKYLPIVSLNYSQTLDHDTDDNTYKYGFNISIPLDFKGLNDSRSANLNYLKSKQEYELTKLKEMTFINTQLISISNIENKISLTKQNILAYDKLLSQTKEFLDAGLKTKDDVKVLENSKNNEKLNIDLYKIDKQIELLELYKRIYSDKI